MIWLDRKGEFKKIIMTLNILNLEFVGAFNFIVREKKIVKLYEAEVPRYCLFLSAEGGEYGSTVTVSKNKYVLAREGKPYGLCCVIRNIRHDYYIVAADETNPEAAIRKIVQKSWLKMIFILIVLSLCLGNVLFFICALVSFF